MIFAPAIGIIFLLFFLFRILAFFSVIYLIFSVYAIIKNRLNNQRKHQSPPNETPQLNKSTIIDYGPPHKKKKQRKTSNTKIIFAVIIVVLSGTEYIYTSRTLARIDKKLAAEDKRLNPVLEENTVIGGLLIPKGTKLEYYRPDEDRFISATFVKPYNYRGLKINFLQNPSKNDATLKLAEPTEVYGFECQPDMKIHISFDKPSMDNCRLNKQIIFNGIKWSIGSIARVSDSYIVLEGGADFVIKKTKYKNTFLKYMYNKKNKSEEYKDKTGKHLFVNKGNQPIYNSTTNPNGTYTMQFKVGSGLYYMITNADTGESYRGKTNKEGKTEAIITQHPARYYFDIVWITAKPKKY